MKILLGLQLGGATFGPDVEGDAAKTARIGEPAWGPSALLHDLELRLGLPEIDESPSRRLRRERECDLSLDHLLVSRRHAVFEVSAENVTVEDLATGNGVIVNGLRIDPSVGVRSASATGSSSVHKSSRFSPPAKHSRHPLPMAWFDPLRRAQRARRDVG